MQACKSTISMQEHCITCAAGKHVAVLLLLLCHLKAHRKHHITRGCACQRAVVCICTAPVNSTASPCVQRALLMQCTASKANTKHCGEPVTLKLGMVLIVGRPIVYGAPCTCTCIQMNNCVQDCRLQAAGKTACANKNAHHIASCCDAPACSYVA
jgi:hypothetical protein